MLETYGLLAEVRVHEPPGWEWGMKNLCGGLWLIGTVVEWSPLPNWRSAARFPLTTFSGQSYKQFTIVIYDSRIVIWGNFKSGMTLES